MKFVTFIRADGMERAGWLEGNTVVDMELASEGALPADLLTYIEKQEYYEQIRHGLRVPSEARFLIEEVTLVAPLPRPPSIRDFYAFEEHVKNARARRGLNVVREWYEVPVFYFSNHRAVVGPEAYVNKPANTEKLDYELEIACVIGKKGRNISKEKAEDYIFGYCIMNDWSARDIQRQEVAVGLGPAKAKDFATSFGPYLVTKNELEPYRLGDVFDLQMTAKVNGIVLTEGNMQTIHYSFAKMIARASQDVTLYPGDVIGSGTVGNGCLLELGEEVHRWLLPGDVVELEITGLGVLKNMIK
ncbi:fumarylacetoacetate hydrolase family protein [Priestia taiwanensis]|uniref:Fumarylacetoacetase n=1 Tax=Priestia taiwanensis TaxID=1347902 RepID=A0A917ASY0_9BACI|nr:fumarylacetoacetate hydrolase family protein [Priestia taiwanensis]MBM7364179.1 2-keto-4-pentenoate hydratase/2-oxohepta-3-ene-1,7-dioic acid hydratase in catechol pathway [Priestia taiwanensis]GGE72266.1 fumarylacetoacetase [Priestia taiwanensis]